jgi:hypothetical protein
MLDPFVLLSGCEPPEVQTDLLGRIPDAPGALSHGLDMHRSLSGAICCTFAIGGE